MAGVMICCSGIQLGVSSSLFIHEKTGFTAGIAVSFLPTDGDFLGLRGEGSGDFIGKIGAYAKRDRTSTLCLRPRRGGLLAICFWPRIKEIPARSSSLFLRPSLSSCFPSRRYDRLRFLRIDPTSIPRRFFPRSV
jgi:hypothetical protein